MVGDCEEDIFGKKAYEFHITNFESNGYKHNKIMYDVLEENIRTHHCRAYCDYKDLIRLKLYKILDDSQGFVWKAELYFIKLMEIIDKIGVDNFEVFEKYNDKLIEDNLKDEEVDKINKWFEENGINEYKKIQYKDEY